MKKNTELEWQGVSLHEAQIATVRVEGVDSSGDKFQVVYDRGAVIVTEKYASPAPARRFLSARELDGLLEALRSAIEHPPSGLDLRAMHVLIAMLAQLRNSPQPTTFGIASFGKVRREGSALVGQVTADPSRPTAVRDDGGRLLLEVSRAGVEGVQSRRLTLKEIRSLITALRQRKASAASLDDLWSVILSNAMSQVARVEAGVEAASPRGSTSAQRSKGGR